MRPGTDGALALGIAHVMIERGWYDRDFIRDWTNGPLLVRADNGRLLTEQRPLCPISRSADNTRRYVAWDEASGGPLLYDPATGGYTKCWIIKLNVELALFGEFTIETHKRCRSSAGPRSTSRPNCAGAIHRRRSRRSAASRPTRSRTPPGCSGKRGLLPTMPGAASRCRPTPPRSPGRSPSSTR